MGTLVLGGSADNSAFAGNASGGVSLISGTLVLDKTSPTLQDTALGSGAIGMNGGTLTARNHAAVFTNRVDFTQQGSGANATHFAGNQAITFSGLAQGILNSGQNYIVSNDITTANLTFSGTLQGFSSDRLGAVNSTLEFNGSGTTVVTGVIRNTDPLFANAVSMTTGLSKTGPGLLILQNANTYTGFLPNGSSVSTGILGGYLRAHAAGALGTGNLLISEANYSSGMNAVLELGTGNTTFSRNLGTTGEDTVQIGSTSGNALNNGGFASVTCPAIVNLNGGTEPVTYGTTGFFPAGGSLILGSPNVAGTVDFQNPINLANGNTSNITRTINTLNGAAAVDGIISGVIANASGSGSNNGIRKTGSGTLLLAANNTYTGPTTVSAGTLLVNADQAGSGICTIAAGAFLGGTGLLTGPTTVKGGLTPGDGVGSLSFNGGLTLSPAAPGTLRFDLGAPTSAGVSYDSVSTASLELGAGTLGFSSFQFTNTGGLAVGTYTLISSATPITGSLGGTVSGSIGSFTGALSISGGTGLVLTVAGGGPTPYDTWAGSFPGFTPTTPSLDFDRDGLANLLEFVLGANPTTNDSPSIRPTVTATGSGPGAALLVTFNRSDISELQPVTVKVQVSADPVTWSPANDIIIGAANGIGPNSVTYTVAEGAGASGIDVIAVTIPNSSATRKFVRVVANY